MRHGLWTVINRISLVYSLTCFVNTSRADVFDLNKTFVSFRLYMDKLRYMRIWVLEADINDWECPNSHHSVESPSMVDPQWNIWYWGSKWNLHTVCWSAVGCEWGTTSVYFGITYVCFIPSRLPVFAVEPQYLLQYFFIFVKRIIWITHIKSSKNVMLV